MAIDESKVEEVFFCALDMGSEEERSAYLDEACKGDKLLRSRVQRLLDAKPKLGSFLQGDAGDIAATIDHHIAEKPGAQVGPYKLLQQIGEGGMGVVYMAEQSEPVERRVALKIIKLGMDTRKVIARFEAERQALAMMDHPNIATVLDAGTTETGRPYFVMELVKGVPITEHCDQQELTPQERLELFVPVCRAVQHAHQKGIIHRDIKPSNVLVAQYDGKPVPIVIDFGVAKAIEQRLTERTVFTEFGQVVGTIEYMSPEQAEFNQFDIDTRTDVYSLGVLLYELLTGETPFDRERLRSAAFDELMRIIRDEEPPRPSLKLSTSESLPSIAAKRHVNPKQLSALVQGELDWIVMKALEKDRARRYDTASKFAEDVQHYLNDEAVLACPPSAVYRFRKFARRNKAIFGTTVLVAASLIVGSGVALWQAYEAEHERERAVVAESQALQEADRARRAEELAEERLRIVTNQRNEIAREKQRADTEAAVAKAVNEFLNEDLLGMADAESQVEADMAPDPNIKLRTILDRGAEVIDGRFSDHPQSKAAIHHTLGKTYRRIGAYDEAEEQEQRALKLLRQELGDEDPATLASVHNLAGLYEDQGRYEEAEELNQQTLEIRRRTLGNEHLDTLASMYSLASVYSRQGRYSEAEQLHQQTLEIRRRKQGDEHPDTLDSMHALASVYAGQNRYEEAEQLYQQTLEMTRRTKGDEHPDTLATMHMLAAVYDKQGRGEDSEELIRRTLELKRRTLGPEHPSTLNSMGNLAEEYQDQGRLEEAEQLYQEMLKIAGRTLGDEHPITLGHMNGLALLYWRQDRLEEAEQLSRRTVEILRRTLGQEHPSTLTSMNTLGLACRGLDRIDEAVQIHQQTLEIARRTLGEEHRLARVSLENLEFCAWELCTTEERTQSDFQLALKCAQTVVELRPDNAKSWDHLGVAYYRNGSWEKAVEQLEKARMLREGRDPEHAFFLAMAYWKNGQEDLALAHYKEAALWMLEGDRDDEQRRFQAEAEEVLGLTKKDRMAMIVEPVSDEIEQAPTNPARWIQRAQLYAKLEAWDESAANWATAIELSEDLNDWNSPRKRVCRELAALPEVFSRVAQLLSSERTLWIGRGQRCSLCSQWSKAGSDYKRAFQTEPLTDETIFEYAGTLLLLGNKLDYEQICHRLVDVAEEPQDSFADFFLARTCGIGPSEQVKPQRLVDWATRWLQADDRPWVLHVLGLAQYRAGEFELAIENLEKSNAGDWYELAKTQNWLVMAMAHWRLEQLNEARQCLQRAQRAIDQAQPQEPDQPVDVPVPDWVEIQLLRREAESLINLNEATEDEQEKGDSEILTEE